MLPDIPDNMINGEADPTPLFADMLDHFIEEAADGSLRLRVPPSAHGPLSTSGNVGVHHEPEMFFQMQGATDFATPGGSFRLLPGSVCLMPPLVAHREQTLRWQGRPFVNIVLMFHRDWLYLHIALAGPDRVPVGMRGHRFTGERIPIITQCLADAAAAHVADTPGAAARCRGNMLAALGHVRDSLDTHLPAETSIHSKVTRCRDLAVSHLSNPDLNVRELARRVGCSADYLSNLFHREVGVRLTAWLNDQRIGRAKDLLRDSPLNISEIAWATGYRDPGYLARRFRAVTGLSPREFRSQHGSNK